MMSRKYFFSGWKFSSVALAFAIFVGASNNSIAEGYATESPVKSIQVTTHTQNDVTQFFVENRELSDVTVTFEMGLANLKGNVDFPCTRTIPGNSKLEMFEVSPVNKSQTWEYTYTNYYKLGSNGATHDNSFLYQLPYAHGSAFKVSQGYDGSFSHKGSNKYAIDWKMPLGTPVFATRGGLVVKIKDDSEVGGADIKYDIFNNYILIRHDDGTLGHYCHLLKGGVEVRPGQSVKTGDLIAHSGNTGFSSGPHLHFSVYKTKNGRERESIPIVFATTDSPFGITLQAGRNYKTPQENTVTASVSNPSNVVR